jgi:endonuclease G
MAVINPQADLDTAARFARASAQQKATSDEAKAYAEAQRRDFVEDTGNSFLESIIADSDLLPIRHFAVGQLAAATVGRIFLAAPDGSGTGFATGFLVAPGILLTNWHVLQSPVWARSATLTMDAEG